MTELVQGAPCPVSSIGIEVRLARGRKSGKPSIMFICPLDGKHFRGFITYRPYVQQVMELAESGQEGLSEGAPC